MLKVYRSSFEAKELRGYGTDDSPAPLPISAAERAAAQHMAAGAFPPPEALSETLRTRFPTASQPERPPTSPSPPGAAPHAGGKTQRSVPCTARAVMSMAGRPLSVASATESRVAGW
jgi:hypothetical protein